MLGDTHAVGSTGAASISVIMMGVGDGVLGGEAPVFSATCTSAEAKKGKGREDNNERGC